VGAQELPDAARKVEFAIERTLSDARGRWLLDPSHQDARSEVSLTGVTGGQVVSVRIDRTFVDESGDRWVIDFKTSSHEGGGLEEFLDSEIGRYKEQLSLYRSLIANFDARPVRVALYFPMIGTWREVGNETEPRTSAAYTGVKSSFSQ
jgi:hypothetical protein